MHVTDDSHSLYGFLHPQEKDLFTLLISVSGVGPNTARVMLSYMSTDELKAAIVHENVAALNKVKGIGPKTAKRIILDLKDKMIKLVGDEPLTASTQTTNSVADEASSALQALGFPKVQIEKQIKAVLGSGAPIKNVEELIKVVLKQMR